MGTALFILALGVYFLCGLLSSFGQYMLTYKNHVNDDEDDLRTYKIGLGAVFWLGPLWMLFMAFMLWCYFFSNVLYSLFVFLRDNEHLQRDDKEGGKGSKTE